ncbi:MAG: hypothetical protein PHT49_06375 [Desulfovibrionales bacterium]|nr:hypothetical protein [Desulfovibrionales bacterium]
MEPTKCQETNEPGQGKEMTPESLSDLAHMLNVCYAKVNFIIDFFAQDGITTFQFSDSGLYGLYLVLRDIEEDLKHVSDGISENDRKNQREINRLTELLNKREPLPKVAAG